jgi:hypothetical protein
MMCDTFHSWLAGKTTLVNYILTEKHGKKIAVVENEFGELLASCLHLACCYQKHSICWSSSA